jgi:hypothetical protein
MYLLSGKSRHLPPLLRLRQRLEENLTPKEVILPVAQITALHRQQGRMPLTIYRQVMVN